MALHLHKLLTIDYALNVETHMGDEGGEELCEKKSQEDDSWE